MFFIFKIETAKRVPASVCSLALLTLVSACAHVQTRSAAPPRSVGEVIQQDINASASGSMASKSDSQSHDVVMTDAGEIIVRGVKLQNTKFDYPVVVNSRVEYWVDYFTGRGRPYFEKYLERSEFFIPYIDPLLKEKGMPRDLVYLAMIESGFNNFARSRAKAVGPWQFMSATGQRYGLMVNWWVDERRDIKKSTLSAVEYLRDLHSMFGSWELAAAAYNSGEAKIARAVQRFGTKDFWEISRHRFLRPETRDYVPKIMAAAIIAKNRVQFGFPASNTKPAADEAVAGDGEVVKVIKTDKPEEQLAKQALTAELAQGELVSANVNDDDEDSDDDERGQEAAGITQTSLVSQTEVAASPTPLAASTENMPLAKPVPTPHLTRDGQIGGEQLAEFDVQSPADLLKVARAAGLSYQTVKSLNPELLRWCTPPTVSSYRIRLPASLKEKFLSTYNHVAFPRKVQFLAYKVRRGETLARIARHFGIKADPMSDLNGVSSRVPLRSGLKVLLPMPNDRSRSLASLDVRDPPEKHSRHGGRRHRGHFYKINYKRRESARTAARKRHSDT